MSISNLGQDTAGHDGGYESSASDQLADPEWDAFVTQVPGGSLVQLSLWAQVKTGIRWRADRICIRVDRKIVGGAQVLTHYFPVLGGIGYVTNGPLCESDDPRILQAIMKGLFDLCKRQRIQYLVIQPPRGAESVTAQLPGFGLQPTLIDVAIRSTILVDLDQDEKAMLSQMNESKRRSVRISNRAGVSVREGTGDDLPIFYELYSATSKRQSSIPYPRDYINDMYAILAPPRLLKLFIAELDDEPVSAALVAPFGRTVEWRLLGWSGLHREDSPNDGLIWGTMMWAKAHGYRFFDLGGIDVLSARSIAEKSKLPDAVRKSPAMFKIGFGGALSHLPQAFDYMPNPILRPAFRMLWHQKRAISLGQRLMAWIGA